jgi:hypothetical protein
MIDPAQGLFDSFDSWATLERLIDNGEAEGPYLECKTSSGIHLQQGHRTHLAQALSGFSNTAGGIVIWGISTTRHAHTGLDVLTQLEPVGNCRSFRQQIDVAVPTLAYPAVEGFKTKTLHPTPGSTKGVVLAYIPRTPGDPVQALGEKQFYLRTGAEFVEMPYDIVKKMFAATAGPDLVPVFDSRIVHQDPGGVWTIPIILSNRSSAAAERAYVTVTVVNPTACANIASGDLQDVSAMNPGSRIYAKEVDTPIFRGINRIAGSLHVTMKKGKMPARILNLRIRVFSTNMRAHEWVMRIQLAKKGFSVKQTKDGFIY